jgi:Ca-activated chloride channel homolog
MPRCKQSHFSHAIAFFTHNSGPQFRFSFRFASLAVTVLTVLVSPLLWSQQSFTELSSMPVAHAGTLRASVEEVALVLSVTDHKGHFVKSLRPSDFMVLDNNEKQTALTFFQTETDLPLRIALLLDVSSSVGARFDTEQGTIHAFLRTVVRRTDAAALFAFNQNVQMVAPVADNWKQIRRSIKRLKPSGETAIFDAIVSASSWLSQDRRPARRIVILVTDGEENSSHSNLEQSVSAALKSEASIYTVNVNPGDWDENQKKGKRILKQLTDATGGSYLQVNADGDATSAFDKIRRELRNQYALAYRPSNMASRSFHQLVVLASRNLRVRCRSGYYVK